MFELTGLFMPPPTDMRVGWRHYVFGLSVRGCFRPGVRPASTIGYEPMDGSFHQTFLVDDVVEGTDELIRF